VPLDESGGGFVDGLDWSAGGGVLCMELEDESGAAGAVVEESAGALGAVDCCLEQATIASALKHNKRRLRCIDHLTVYLSIGLSICRVIPARWKQRLVASSVPSRAFLAPVSSRLRPPHRAPDMLRALGCSWGK
jgi:hypothetical protein